MVVQLGRWALRDRSRWVIFGAALGFLSLGLLSIHIVPSFFCEGFFSIQSRPHSRRVVACLWPLSCGGETSKRQVPFSYFFCCPSGASTFLVLVYSYLEGASAFFFFHFGRE